MKLNSQPKKGKGARGLLSRGLVRRNITNCKESVRGIARDKAKSRGSAVKTVTLSVETNTRVSRVIGRVGRECALGA